MNFPEALERTVDAILIAVQQDQPGRFATLASQVDNVIAAGTEEGAARIILELIASMIDAIPMLIDPLSGATMLRATVLRLMSRAGMF